MTVRLPMFKGYTVDLKLKQFRKVDKQRIEFISFDSEKGERILDGYIKSLNLKSKEFKKLIHYF